MKIVNQIKEIYQPYMFRPTIYQCVTKSSIALVLALLWDRFINVDGILSLVRDAFFVVGIFFLACVWFQYLRFDGVKMDRISKTEKKKEKKRFFTKDIVDYADEKIISYAELEEEEQAVCRFLSNVICCVVFLLLAVGALVIF